MPAGLNVVLVGRRIPWTNDYKDGSIQVNFQFVMWFLFSSAILRRGPKFSTSIPPAWGCKVSPMFQHDETIAL